MTSDKKQVTTSDDHDARSDDARSDDARSDDARSDDARSDELSPVVADALAELLLPPLDDKIDLETAAKALTKEDREALAALGSSRELVARIVAAGKAKKSVAAQVDRSTQMVSESMLSTQVTGNPQSPEPTEPTVEFGELMKRLQDCEGGESLSWSCDYTLKGVIGRGGQGTVFLIECLTERNLPKAMKVFSPQPYGDVKSYYEDMERMAQVASLVYRIQVDNLVIIERFTYHNGICLMIMRWIDGHDLAKLLQPSLLEQLHGCVGEDRWKHLNNVVVTTLGTVQLRLMPGMAVNIIEKCLRALDALHSHGIVHGDIKPSNIMLDRYGSIRLIDIGSAFELSAPPGRHAWTPRYAPPEISAGGKWTPQSDLASLGYVLIEMLSGQPAISNPSIGSASMRTTDAALEQKLLEEKRHLPERLDELLPAHVKESRQLMNICRRLIDPDLRKRFTSAEEALEGKDGTYQFLQDLTRMGLAVHYSQEIKRWLANVKTALQ